MRRNVLQYKTASVLRIMVSLALISMLAACGGNRVGRDIYGPGPNGRYQVGAPYCVKGIWYYPSEDVTYNQIGMASWYGREFGGNDTALGERFDPRRLTAAHTTLPLPVLVRVTNLQNNKSIVLRVNDRGPFLAGRIIDVSEAAAEELGFRQQGTTQVRVEYVGRADGKPPELVPQPNLVASPAEPTSALPPDNPPIPSDPSAAPAAPAPNPEVMAY